MSGFRRKHAWLTVPPPAAQAGRRARLWRSIRSLPHCLHWGAVVRCTLGGQFFTKSGDVWRSESLPVRMNVQSSAVDLFMPLIAGLLERPRQTINGRQQRVFAGSITWQTGRDRNEGALQILIDAQTELPTSASFEGHCVSAKCSFSQSFTYDKDIRIRPPI